MSKYDEIKDLLDKDFRRLIGVKKKTFSKMMEVLHPIETKRRSLGGKKPRLCLEDRLLMSLEYLREYRTFFHLGQSYGFGESGCFKICRWVENAMIKSRAFSLPGKKALLNQDIDYVVVLVDATESPVERPKRKKLVKHGKNKQKEYYSGKKKRHTLKAQVVMDKKAARIMCTNFSEGKKHDIRLFKESGVRIKKDTEVKTDSGYQGIQKIHKNSQTPHKSSKNKKLTKEQKQQNRKLARERILNEHVIGKLKRFKIIAERYRNRRKRFGLRFNIIAGIYNFEFS